MRSCLIRLMRAAPCDSTGLMFRRFWCASGVGGVDGELVAGVRASVPAAVALLLLDAGVVAPLMARVAEVWRQHVCPQALVLGRDEAGQVVARLDLQTQDGWAFIPHAEQLWTRALCFQVCDECRTQRALHRRTCYVLKDAGFLLKSDVFNAGFSLLNEHLHVIIMPL